MISGVIDVNDSMHTIRVAELAIAVAYAMLRQRDPLKAAACVVSGFNSGEIPRLGVGEGLDVGELDLPAGQYILLVQDRGCDGESTEMPFSATSGDVRRRPATH